MSVAAYELPEKPSGERVWNRILRASLTLPGAKVDRDSFLASQLANYCNEEQVRKAIRLRPATAGIPSDVIDRRADASIRSHVLRASGISFAAGLPGGWAMAGTIPADVPQFYWHALVLAQKLAYLYGWPDILDGGEVDEETEIHLTLLVGAMMGAASGAHEDSVLSHREEGGGVDRHQNHEADIRRGTVEDSPSNRGCRVCRRDGGNDAANG